MGTYNTFLMDVTVPAAQVALLAAALRDEMKDWYPQDEIAAAGDRDLVAWALFAAEGGSDDYGAGPGEDFTAVIQAGREDGSVAVRSGGYGKMSFDSDVVEGLYASCGAIGRVECELDDGITDRYVVVLGGGLARTFEGQVVYPTSEAQERALRLFVAFLAGSGTGEADLLHALSEVAVEGAGVGA